MTNRKKNIDNLKGDFAPHLLKTAAKGSIIGFGGSIAGKIFALVLQVAISRFFGPEFFGLFITGIITCQFFRIMGSLGLAKGGLRFLAIAVEQKKIKSLPGIFATVIIFSIIPGIVTSIILYHISPFIATTWFNDNEMVMVLKLFSFSVPFLILLRTVSELSRGFKTIKYSILIEDLIFPISQIVFFLIFYYFHYGFYSVVYSFITGCILSAALIILIVRYQIKKIFAQQYSADKFRNLIFPLPWREILKFSLPFIPIALSLIGYNYVDVIMLNIFSDSQNVGLYAAASRLGLIFSMIFMSSSKIFTPLVAASYGVNKNDNIKLLYQAITRWMLYINIPIFIFVLLYSEQIMMLFGNKFLENCPRTLIILSAGHIFASITGGVGIILTMTGHQYKELSNVIAGLVINIFLNILLIPVYGIVGAALATTISRLIINTARIVIVFIIFKIQPFTRKNIIVIMSCSLIYICYLFILNIGALNNNVSEYIFGIIAEVLLIAIIIKFGFEKNDYSIINSILKNKLMSGRNVMRPKRRPNEH
jgi:O-antigen/teichoic acid export membrane protein